MKVSKDYLTKFLQSVADGYPTRIQEPDFGHFPNYYVTVYNPDYEEDDGSDPYLVLEVKP